MMSDNTALVSSRPIRSFVLREGRMTPGQQKALKEFWPLYGLDIHQPLIIMTPTVLEIGFGMGDSLLGQAKHYPQAHFIGIEVHKPGAGSLLLKLHQQNIQNLRIYCHDAVEILKLKIPDNSLDKIQIFFPDPWQKKRHHKRRLIQADFIKLCHSKLRTGGFLHVATDWENYGEQIDSVLFYKGKSLSDNLFEKVDPLKVPYPRPVTKFEQRGKKMGHAIWDFAGIKKQP